jgi:hypothetical protein
MEINRKPIFNIDDLKVELKIAEIRVVKFIWFAVGFVTAIVLVIIATF